MLERRLAQKISEAAGDLSLITPGLRVGVIHEGRLKADIALGDTYRYYDLASLTKILFTVPLAMRLVDRGNLGLQTELHKNLNWFRPRGVSVRSLLTHTAGMPWWFPFYKKLDRARDLVEARERVIPWLASMKKSRRKKAVYSDIDFILLSYMFEAVARKSLVELWENLPLRSICRSLHFNLFNQPTYARGLYAPTERCPWRKKTLQGEVHDDNTWSFGGISTHAGLFGTFDDVLEYGRLMRRALRGDSPRALASSETVRQFTRRAIPRTVGDWALGYMMPTKGAASCGRYFSPQSFGHTGFTGTSYWHDPKRDLIVVCLSNRVHPTRKNTRFVKFRPVIHDIICRELD